MMILLISFMLEPEEGNIYWHFSQEHCAALILVAHKESLFVYCQPRIRLMENWQGRKCAHIFDEIQM